MNKPFWTVIICIFLTGLPFQSERKKWYHQAENIISFTRSSYFMLACYNESCSHVSIKKIILCLFNRENKVFSYRTITLLFVHFPIINLIYFSIIYTLKVFSSHPQWCLPLKMSLFSVCWKKIKTKREAESVFSSKIMSFDIWEVETLRYFI